MAEESCIAYETNDKQISIEKAKESYRKERLLAKQREEKNLMEQNNPELTGFVLLNLACQYSNSGSYTEALNMYNTISKNKTFQLAGRLKTNIGNIHFQQKQHLKAIKMYRMALDQIPVTNQDLKLHIHQNIALAFIKMGQFIEAASNYEIIFKERPDFKTGFNLLLCYYALGDRPRMKMCFMELLKIPVRLPDEDDYQVCNIPQTKERYFFMFNREYSKDNFARQGRFKKMKVKKHKK